MNTSESHIWESGCCHVLNRKPRTLGKLNQRHIFLSILLSFRPLHHLQVWDFLQSFSWDGNALCATQHRSGGALSCCAALRHTNPHHIPGKFFSYLVSIPAGISPSFTGLVPEWVSPSDPAMPRGENLETPAYQLVMFAGPSEVGWEQLCLTVFAQLTQCSTCKQSWSAENMSQQTQSSSPKNSTAPCSREIGLFSFPQIT